MNIIQKFKRKFDSMFLCSISRQVLRDRLTYLSVDKLKRLERVLVEANGIPGDMVEFGVALGGSAIIIAHESHANRNFHGFDVFEMIPPPASEKDDFKSKERYEIIKSGRSEGIAGDEYYGYKNDLISEVKSAFNKYGISVDGDRVCLHKGLFEETWGSAGINQIALAHIDCDWYDPVLFCLHACADKLSDGGALIIDDYNDYGGCRLAVDEFLAGRGDFMIELGSNPILWKRTLHKD